MNWSLDVQTWLPGNVPVTYTSTRNAGDVAQTVPNAIPYPVTATDQDNSGGRYQANDVTWSLRLAELTWLGVNVPKPADTITDQAGTVWTAIDVTPAPFAGFVKVVTRNLIIALGLEDTVDIQVPTVTPGATGGRKNTWTTKYAGLVVRMQPAETDDYTERGKSATAAKYTCIVSRQIDPRSDAGDWGRIYWKGGYYQITAYRKAEQIGALPEIDCVSQPEPPIPPPGAPTNLVVTPGNARLVLTWTAPVGVGLTYRVYRGTAPGAELATPIASLLSPTTYTDTAVVAGTTYYYRVTAVQGGLESGRSNEASGRAQTLHTQVYTAAGNYTFDCTGKVVVAIRCRGDGGGGQQGFVNGDPIATGGGGSFISGVPTNSPASMDIAVPGGGPINSNNTGSVAQVTWDGVSTYLSAGGGAGGTSSGAGGISSYAGNVTSVVQHTGGNGTTGIVTGAEGGPNGGGGAGSAANGQNAVAGGLGGAPDGGNGDTNGIHNGGPLQGGGTTNLFGTPSPGWPGKVEIDYLA